ncbi:MAG: hypothetical protein KJ592_03200 [Nanoarchaeota archaeon]|nr:hypothetical protein [Nanoarchaeota archaeon]
MRNGLVAVCAGLALGGCGRFDVDAHRAIYGTLDKPAYSIKAEVGGQETLATSNCRENNFYYLRDFEWEVGELEKKKGLSSEDRASLENYISPDEMGNERFHRTIDFYGNVTKSFREKEGQYGDILGLAGEVFFELTGRSLPSGLEISLMRGGDEKIVGVHRPDKNWVWFRDRGYEISLGTIFHELGHVVYQGGEANYRNCRKDVEIIEEAAGFLFRMAGVEKVRDKNSELWESMKFSLVLEREGFVEDYSRGSRDVHACGWALADSLVDYFGGDVGGAFDYLLRKDRLEEFDLDVLERMERLKEGVPFSEEEFKVRWEKVMERAQKIKDFLRGSSADGGLTDVGGSALPGGSSADGWLSFAGVLVV